MDYDFTTLSPEDFEILVADLFSREWGTILEVFKAGKDGGIDLRHSRNLANNPECIVQCKRYAPHSYQELRRSISKEVKKLKKLKPERYVVATSTRLSASNKDDLLGILNPWCKGTDDIYGPSELNILLRKYPEVLRSHFKLWMSSTVVLEQILHSRIFNVTNDTVDEVKAQMCRLVVHDGFERARTLLHENHHCVIAGNPGIGKTTLARMLMCHYLKEDYIPLVAVGDISDAWSIISKASATSNKYVVLYDDFLGTFGFDENKFEKNEDTSLMRFVEKVRNASNLRFILTTREYILADARRKHGTFQRDADKLAQCTILIDDYAKDNRGRVLFNHLYFSYLPDSRLQLIVKNKLYKDIIEHEHFNPRIVETISSQANSASLTDEEYAAYIRGKFDDPSELWEYPFEHQISPTARQVLLLLWSYGGSVELEILKESLSALRHNDRALDASIIFRDAIKELNGNFIICNRCTRGLDDNAIATYIRFQNPSVEEFIERFVIGEQIWMDELARCSTYYLQIEHLQSWAQPAWGQPRSEIKVSANYWSLLHESGIRCENRKAGGVLRYEGRPDLVYTKNDMRNAVDRTQVLLRIAVNASAQDDRSAELWRRVTTADGWSILLKDTPTDRASAHGARRLITWLHSMPEREFELEMCRVSFSEALNALLENDDALDMDISSLKQLQDCTTILGCPQMLEVEKAYERVISAAVESLADNEEDADSIDGEIAALKELSKGANITADSHISRLRHLVENIRERESEKESSSSDGEEYSSEDDSNTGIDLDDMFMSLLDRSEADDKESNGDLANI